MAQVFIQRTLQPDGLDLMIYSAVDGEGHKLPLVESLGLIELAKNGLLNDITCCCENGHQVEGGADTHGDN